jgi:hypothetical protein
MSMHTILHVQHMNQICTLFPIFHCSTPNITRIFPETNRGTSDPWTHILGLPQSPTPLHLRTSRTLLEPASPYMTAVLTTREAESL